jgi:hypothetical protein
MKFETYRTPNYFSDENIYLYGWKGRGRFGDSIVSEEDDELDEEFDSDDVDDGWEEDFDDENE